MNNAYPTYRESGIEWVGAIPTTWSVTPIFAAVDTVKAKNSMLAETNLLSLSFGRIVRKDIDANEGLLPETFESYQIVERDDIVFRFTDLQNDKRSLRSALVGERGIITSAYLAITPRAHEPAYLAYLSRAYDAQKVFYAMGGGLRQSMKFDDVRRLPLLCPPLDEQRQIAEYLDRETGKIDELIAKQEQLVATLTERRQAVIAQAVTRGLDSKARLIDSGVGLPFSTRHASGHNPQGWSSDKLSRHFVAKKGSTAALLTREYCAAVAGEFPVFSGQTENAGVLARIDSYEFDSGDHGVLFSTTVGARAMTVRHIFGKFSLSQNCMIIQRRQNANMRFYFYFFQNLFAAKRAELSEHMQASFTMNDLYSFQILLPPLTTQAEIARWLDLEMVKLDDLSAKVVDTMNLLRERRAALISAAVTGKIDVRGL